MISNLTDFLTKNIPFTYTKFGDGEIICILKTFKEGESNCDYQYYSDNLSESLIQSLRFYSDKKNVYIGEWDFGDLCHFGFADFVIKNELKLNFVPYSLLLHIETDEIACTPLSELRIFYDALKSRVNKVYVCPSKLNAAKDFLNCDIVNIKENDAFSEYERIKDELLQSDYDVFMYSAGLMSKVLIADLMKAKPNTTHIDIGSGLDNLFIGITRKYQIDTTKALLLYNL
jgi:hypothetical protein